MAHRPQREHGFSKWAVLDRTSGHLIGGRGLQFLDGGPAIELGFHLDRSHWGHGFATEAAGAALAWALARRPEPVVAIVDPDNDRSRRVLERIGMTADGMQEYFGRTGKLYRVAGQGSSTSGRRSPGIAIAMAMGADPQ